MTVSAGTLACCLALPAAAAAADAEDLASLSLEELVNTRVTSVSKRAESIGDAAASVFVISSDDIRRSGAANLPEALRLAPNLQVARVDARNYAVTARGFNSAFENKLLVLIDGRSVYTPLFSGVFWDAQDVVLEDVERIEVISGPGATLWGANAVNGVINVITKPAGATQGLLATAAASRFQRDATVRFGGAAPAGGRYRVYAKIIENDDLHTEAGRVSLTGMHRSQAGFRSDWGQAERTVTFQGDAYDGRLHQQGTRDIRIAGANLLGRTALRLDGGSELTAQAYWDHTERDQPNAFVEHLDTLDVQAQSATTISPEQRVVFGAGYRASHDRLDNGAAFAFLPATLNMHWGNVFVQDELNLTSQLRLIGGLKFEHNNYTGWEVLPTLRLAWKATPDTLLWTALSRSVRAPSRIDRDFYSPPNPRVVAGVPQYAFAGGPDFDSEVAKVLELGYRAQLLPGVSYSATAFISDYDKLRTLEPAPGGIGSVFSNLASGRTRGIEMWASWQPVQSWRLSGGLVAQHITTRLDAASKDASGTTGLATSDPSSFWKLRSSWTIAEGQSLDVQLRHYGKLDRPAVPAYNAMAASYLWQVNPDLDLQLTGDNLLAAHHAEYGAAPNRPIYERSIGLKAVWHR